jgi:hypothetical protein
VDRVNLSQNFDSKGQDYQIGKRREKTGAAAGATVGENLRISNTLLANPEISDLRETPKEIRSGLAASNHIAGCRNK